MGQADGRVGWHVGGLTGALFGYFIGGAWVWGMRIFGTLGFGKEAMGLGDVHLMAAVGAVCGWIVPSVAFFVAPFFGLLWALTLLFGKGQHELPYGPWLSLASVTVMIFYDSFAAGLDAYRQFAGL
jgi:leader peptidase (prepilin peptidase)/N-methyltransferase